MTNYAIVLTNNGWTQLYTLLQAGIPGKTEAEMEEIARANPVTNLTKNSWNYKTLNPHNVGATSSTNNITGCSVDELNPSSGSWANTSSGGTSGNWYTGTNIKFYLKPTTSGTIYKARFAPIHDGQWFGEYTIKVFAYFVENYTITASAGTGGTITPSGAQTVTGGSSKTFTINANSGYTIKAIKVDNISIGVSMVSTYQYTFSNVTANHTISAEFEADDWTVLLKVSTDSVSKCKLRYKIGSGSWTTINSPTTAGTSVTVPNGTDLQVECIDISYGYQFAQWERVGNVTTNVYDNPLTITQSQAVTEVTCIITPRTYTVTSSAGDNGTISPRGTSAVRHGASITFTITANSGYRIKQILVDGVPIQL